MEGGPRAVEDLGLDAAAWRGKRVLVTGHTGFKGAWLSLWLEMLGANVTGLSLAPENPEGAFEALAPWTSLHSYVEDIRDAEIVATVMEEAEPEIVFHLAAQSLVRRGYSDPVSTYQTNVLGTVNLLDAIPRAPGARGVVVVTTDKVYRGDDATAPFREGDPLGGADPYSNSKVCVELIVEAWRHSFLGEGQCRVVTARAGNVIGGGDQAPDRLVPDVFRALAAGEPVRLRHPRAVRPWQFVLEPLLGYLLLAQRLLQDGKCPSATNFGPSEESWRPVAEIVDYVLDAWGSGSWVQDERPAPRETSELRLDSSLAQRELQWRERLDLPTALDWTIDWRRNQVDEADMRSFSMRQVDRFQEEAPRGS
ncbi:MAG: CDP-glucose 4,6-dehydratase [Actinomycetota bacterium]|nr:CDP-glucose 4,6-dehydratase [Actinomycetota bacterium]